MNSSSSLLKQTSNKKNKEISLFVCCCLRRWKLFAFFCLALMILLAGIKVWGFFDNFMAFLAMFLGGFIRFIWITEFLCLKTGEKLKIKTILFEFLLEQQRHGFYWENICENLDSRPSRVLKTRNQKSPPPDFALKPHRLPLLLFTGENSRTSFTM